MKKIYLEEGDIFVCDLTFLRIEKDKLSVYNAEGDCYFNGHPLHYDIEKEAYYYEIEEEE